MPAPDFIDKFRLAMEEEMAPAETPTVSHEEANPILAVMMERQQQDKRWGEQNHSPLEWVAILGEEFGEVAKAAIEWRHGVSSDGAPDYRKELVQTAAVCLAAIESLDRCKWRAW